MIKLFLLLLFVIVPMDIFATDYMYSYDRVLANDNLVVEEERLYKYYDEIITYTDNYYIEGDNPNEYPYQSDIMLTKSYYNLFEEPEQSPNRTITYKEALVYQRLKPINRIVIKDLRADYAARKFDITEIKVYYKDKEVGYHNYCIECNEYATTNFNNGKYNETNGSIAFNSVIDIRLDGEYYPDDLKLVFYFYEMDNYKVTFNVFFYDKSVTDIFSYNATYDNLDYIKKKVEIDTSLFSAINNYLGSINIKINQADIINYKWEDKYSLVKDGNYFYNEIPDYKVYYYEDVLFKYYKIDKNYLKGYHLNLSDYIKDEEDFIIRYKYKEKEENNQIVCPIYEKEDDDLKSDYDKETYVYSVYEKDINANKIIKFRLVVVFIIVFVLSVMIYTIYCLRKD